MTLTLNIILICSLVALLVNILNIVGKFSAKSAKSADVNLQNEKISCKLTLS